MAKTGPERVKEIATLQVSERIKLARAKADTLVDRCLEIERIHANNQHLIFGNVFGDNLNHTFAGNAYAALRLTSFSFEVVRVMSLWDSPSRDRVSIPEVIALIDSPSVKSRLKANHVDAYSVEEREFVPTGQIERRFDRAVRHAEYLTKILGESNRVKSLRRHRDKFYAHNLTIESITPKFGYERKLLRSSEHIIDCLRRVLSNTSLDFADARKLNIRHATEFWTGLKWHQPIKSS